MVHHHVAHGTDRVVEVSSVLDAEVLRHRDLHAGDVVPVPHGLEHRVREPQVQDLGEAHLPEEVIDPVQLRLVEVLMHLVVQLARRRQVVPEGLLDHDPRVPRQPGVGERADDLAEQERRDLQVEHGRLRPRDRLPDVGVRVLLREITTHVRETVRESFEHRLVDRFARPLDRGSGVFAQLVDGPVVDRDADDRAVEEPTRFQSVQRPEGHDLREIPRDAEDDEHICGCR